MKKVILGFLMTCSSLSWCGIDYPIFELVCQNNAELVKELNLEAVDLNNYTMQQKRVLAEILQEQKESKDSQVKAPSTWRRVLPWVPNEVLLGIMALHKCGLVSGNPANW